MFNRLTLQLLALIAASSSTVWVDFSLVELPSGDLVLEQAIHLGVCSSHGFWKPEVAVDEAKRTRAGPEEPSLALPVQGVGVDEERSNDVVDDTSNVVKVSSKDDGFGTETGGGHFGDERVTNWANGNIINEGEDLRFEPC